jgi:peroxiredoxin
MKKIIYILFFIISKIIFSQDVNSLAPDFSGKDLNNNSVKLSDLKGKIILLDFWASWCAPCKKSMPFFIDYFNNNKDSSFVILAVNVDTDNENFRNFRSKMEQDFPFIVVLDSENKIIKKYNIEAMPTTLFIDKKGTIRKITTGFTNDSPKEYTEEIEKLVKE